MVFHPFNHEKEIWPSMNQMMEIICAVGDIDMNTDTVMHYDGKEGTERKRILSDINSNLKVRVVMTISAVTAVVDFSVKDWLDRLYACVSGYQDPKKDRPMIAPRPPHP